MADQPGHPCPFTFSSNASMVLHILKEDPMLRDLKHIQVDGPGMAYLFFYDIQGCRGIKQDATETLRAHVAEAFSEWISHSSHFVVILLLLAEGWWRTTATLDRHHQRSRTEYPDCHVPHMVSSSQTPHHHWWRVPHPALPGWDESRKGVAAPPGHPPHG